MKAIGKALNKHLASRKISKKELILRRIKTIMPVQFLRRSHFIVTDEEGKSHGPACHLVD